MPDVQVIATGRPLAFAAPSAKKPLERSSMCECARSRGSRASARTSGVERDPGDVQASVMPAARELVDEGGDQPVHERNVAA